MAGMMPKAGVKIPYAGKEWCSPSPPKDKRPLAERRVKYGRKAKQTISGIAIENDIYCEIVAIARAQKATYSSVVRMLIKLGLEHVDGVKR